ncbi:MAG: diguanylate cyclase [Defluviitaleaceae bacterium]|nr:diguanylate cyclase [Defluviitaleaceae bacterium]
MRKKLLKFQKFYSPNVLLFSLLALILIVGTIIFNYFISNNVRDVIKGLILEVEETHHQNQKLELSRHIEFYSSIVQTLSLTLRDKEEDREEFKRMATEVRTGKDNIDNIFIGFLEDGGLVNTLGFVPPPGWYIQDRYWFIEALAAGEGNIAITNPYLSTANNGALSVAISTYVPNRFVIGAAISIETLVSEFISSIGEGYKYFILNRYGYIIGTTETQYNDISKHITHIYGGDKVFEKISGEQNEIVERVYNTLGIEEAMLFLSRLDGNSDWCLVYLVDLQVISARADYYINIITLFFIVSLFLIFILVFFIIYKFTGSVQSIKSSDDRIKAVINAIPTPMNIVNSNMQLEHANEECYTLFNFDSFEEYQNNFQAVFPEKQPNGKNSLKYGVQFMETASKKGRVEFEWLHIDKNGRSVPCYITLIKVSIDRKDRIISHIQDLRNQELAFTDDLTGIYNRRYFNKIVLDNLINLEIEKHKVSFIVFDIDHFKKINDTYGHLSGDDVLKSVVSIVSSSLRSGYIFARWGGEEFVIFLPKTDEKNAKGLATKLKLEIANTPIVDRESEVINITCSFGVYTHNFGTMEAKSLSYYISNSDKALYQAKETGRNKVVVYEVPTRVYEMPLENG